MDDGNGVGGNGVIRLKTIEERNCCICGKHMQAGYVINDEQYFCSDECLGKIYTKEEFNDLYDEDVAYWTEWYDE